MKYSLVVLLISSCFCAPAMAKIEECTLNGETVSLSHGGTTAGKSGIVRCKDRESGEMMYEREVKNGVFMGLDRFYKNGKLYRERQVNEKGNNHGKLKEFATNGQLVLEENYLNGQERGISQRWTDKGSLLEVRYRGENYDDKARVRFNPDKSLAELECGKSALLGSVANDAEYCGFKSKAVTTRLYSEAGQLRSEFVLLNGEKQKATYYRNDGTPESVEEVLQSKRSEKIYYANGKLRREKLWFNASRPLLIERESEFHESGAKLTEKLYQQNEKEGRKFSELRQESSYFLNGQLKSLIKYSYDGKSEIRDTQFYHDNGKLAEQGRVAYEGRYRARYVGIHQFFSSEGKLQREVHYDENGKIQRERIWDNAGKLLSDELLFEDGSRKAFSK